MGPAASAVSAITSALTTLRAFDEGQWLTLYKHEARAATAARFQATVAGKDDSGMFLWVLAFCMEAAAELRQVVVVKVRSSAVKLQKHAGKLSFAPQTLEALRAALAGKVAAYTADNFSDLEI